MTFKKYRESFIPIKLSNFGSALNSRDTSMLPTVDDMTLKPGMWSNTTVRGKCPAVLKKSASAPISQPEIGGKVNLFTPSLLEKIKLGELREKFSVEHFWQVIC